ncbi:MAG: alpha/beta fold hydrolase [Catenulispora sp.]|nr:alpha/beta fold hydrolase [Catenulispora sp.]
MRRRSAMLGAAALVATGLLAPAGSAAASGTLAGYYAQHLDWQPCAGQPALQCATLAVPRDYGAPWAGDFRLPVIRQQAADPAHRIGSLLVDPGGPGASGLAFLAGNGPLFGAEVRADFDIVSWDRRGIQGSDPTLTCLDTAGLDAFNHLDPAPSTTEGVAGLVDAGRRFTAACRTNSAPGLTGQLGSIANARDMDLLRAALGDSQVNFIGLSYGTFQGFAYAELFPERIRTMTLDGVFDPSLTATRIAVEGAASEESELRHYADVCNVTPGLVCPASTPDGIMAVIDRLQHQVKASPLSATGTTRTVGGNELASALRISASYPPSFHPLLGPALTAAAQGDGTQLLALADSWNGRRSDAPGHNTGYAPDFQDNAALFCTDRPWPSGTAPYGELLAASEAASPHLGAERATMALPCAGWPVTDLPHPVRASGAPPILVVSSIGDPYTPYRWGVDAARTLAHGTLLTSTTHGHTAYLSGYPCVNTNVESYIVSAAPPASGTVC